MRTVVASTAILLACAGASAQVSVHDQLVGQLGHPLTGPLVVNPGVSPRGGTLVYSNTTETGFRANGGSAGFTGPNTPADPTRVLFDDVPVPGGLAHGYPSLDVCRVTVGIRRLASAPATDVNIYWTPVTTTVTAPDTNLDTPPVLAGTVSLPANGATAVTQQVTLGTTGGPTLFTVPLNYTLFDGFATFSIGVGLSNPDGLNGWRLTSGPSPNATGLFWLYDPGHTGQANDEGAYSFGAPPNPASSFYIVVEGNNAPAPAAVSLLGIAGLLATRRRR